MKSYRTILTIGSALIDVFISSDQFEIQHGEEEVFTTRSHGGKLSVDSFKIKTGGGAGNTAVGFVKAGFDVGCIAELGMDELADMVVSDLQFHGVKTHYLIQERKEETGGSVLLVAAGGERTALVHRGAAAMLDPHDLDPAVIAQQDWIHLSSVAGKTDTIQHLFEVCAKANVGISWNPGQAELDILAQHPNDQATRDQIFAQYQDMKHPVQILILNKQEWNTIRHIHDLMLHVIPIIVVTDSVRGGTVYHFGHGQSYQAISVESVDNTGAGDAFSVGFVSAVLHGKSVEDATQWGVKNAAAVVQKPGAKYGLLTLQELQQ